MIPICDEAQDRSSSSTGSASTVSRRDGSGSAVPQRRSASVSEQSVDVPVETLERALSVIFVGAGCPAGEAAVIAEELVLADRMGLGSHGTVRVGEYLDVGLSGRVVPGGTCTVAHETPASALVDGGMNFGQVVW